MPWRKKGAGPAPLQNIYGDHRLTETDLQLGGGYKYQWQCAILLALNYLFDDPLRYNPPLHDLITSFLGKVEQVQLEGIDQQKAQELEESTS